MLEFTNGTIDHIAWTVGYQDPGVSRDLQENHRADAK
jgi:transcriptional regulator GlxA family with amidase domain